MGFNPGAHRPPERVSRRRIDGVRTRRRCRRRCLRSRPSPTSANISTSRFAPTRAACRSGWHSPWRQRFARRSLIIDEALAVGDAAFQRKCFQRIEDFRAAGTTLALRKPRPRDDAARYARAPSFREGRLVRFGSAKQVCDEYEQSLFGAKRRAGAIGSVATSASFDPDYWPQRPARSSTATVWPRSTPAESRTRRASGST